MIDLAQKREALSPAKPDGTRVMTEEAHDVGAARGSDVLLASGRTVLEQTHNHIPSDKCARPLGPYCR